MNKNNDLQFYQLIRKFLTEHLLVRRHYSEQTVRSYKEALNLYRLYFADVKRIRFEKMNFSYFSRENVYDFLIWLKEERGCSAATQNLRLAAIKSFLRYCGEEDIELMPIYLNVSGIHVFKTHSAQQVEYLTPSQLKLLFQTPDTGTKKGRRDRFFLIFAYETGARMAELLNMKLSDIVRSSTLVTVRIVGKGSKLRHVPLEPTTVKHLNAYLKEFHKKSEQDDYLFFTVHDNKHTQMKAGTVHYMMKKHGAIAQQTNPLFPKNLHCHMLRHSIAMAMLKKGIPISYIRDFLGHSCIDTTMIYSHADMDMIAEALATVDHEEHVSNKTSGWKGQEEYLLRYSGLL